MTNSLLLLRIKHPYRNRHKRHIMPSRKDEQFQFRFVTAGKNIQAIEFFQRINAHTSLSVRQRDGCLQTEPEIGEAVSEPAFARHVLIRELTTSNYHGIRMNVVRTHQKWYVFGVMLSIRINGKGVIKTHVDCFSETRNERSSFALVAGMCDHRNRHIYSR